MAALDYHDGMRCLYFKPPHQGFQLLSQVGHLFGIQFNLAAAVGDFVGGLIDIGDVMSDFAAYSGALRHVLVDFLDTCGSLGDAAGDFAGGDRLLFHRRGDGGDNLIDIVDDLGNAGDLRYGLFNGGPNLIFRGDFVCFCSSVPVCVARGVLFEVQCVFWRGKRPEA